MSNNNPTLDFNKLAEVLTPDELALARMIVVQRGDDKGKLLVSKPTVKYEKYFESYTTSEGRTYKLPRRRPTAPTGNAAYVWRMVAFLISKDAKAQCMPVMAFCDLPVDDFDARRKLGAELDAVADKIVDTVKPQDQAGVIRWGQAYGLIGTPQYNEEGAVIYR